MKQKGSYTDSKEMARKLQNTAEASSPRHAEGPSTQSSQRQGAKPSNTNEDNLPEGFVPCKLCGIANGEAMVREENGFLVFGSPQNHICPTCTGILRVKLVPPQRAPQPPQLHQIKGL